MANGAGTLRIFDRAEEMTILALDMTVDFQLEGTALVCCWKACSR